MLPVCVRAAGQGHPRHAGHHQEDLHVTQLQDQDVHAGVRSGDPPVTECIIARDTNNRWIQILLVSVPDPHVYGPPGSGSISQRYGSGSGSSSKNSKKNTLIPTVL